MINGLKTNHYSLWYKIFSFIEMYSKFIGGLFIALFLAFTVALTIFSNPIYQIAYFLATNPFFFGPFQLRWAIMGGGLFLLLSMVISIVMTYRHYYVVPCHIQHEDLDQQLTAIYQKLQHIDEYHLSEPQ